MTGRYRSFFTLIALLGTAILPAQQFAAHDCETFFPIDTSTSFVLVVDRSGSMAGEAMDQAQIAMQAFADRVRADDQIAIVSFADDVTIDLPFGRSRSSIPRAIASLSANGGTRLHDAIAAGVRLLEGQTGIRVIVYLTDGNDNRSNLSLRNISQMNVGEQTIVYGLGLGNVDHGSLRRISRASNGEYQTVTTSRELKTVYESIHTAYYDRFDTNLRDSAALTVTSLPAGRPVLINGRQAGETPLRVDGLTPADYEVQVGFDRGTWTCDAETLSATRTVIRARERDVPLQLVIETAPTRAAVFVNDDYVGMSSMIPSTMVDGRRDVSGQLTVDSIPPGRHTVRVVAAPELDFSPSQVLEFPIEVRDNHVYVKALIFLSQIEDINGNRERVGGMGLGGPPLPSLGDDFGGSSLDDIRSRVPGR